MELSKIEFSKHGWSVITLNPMVLDEEVLKKFLIMIKFHQENVLKVHMRDYPRFNAYSKGISTEQIIIKMEKLSIFN